MADATTWTIATFQLLAVMVPILMNEPFISYFYNLPLENHIDVVRRMSHLLSAIILFFLGLASIRGDATTRAPSQCQVVTADILGDGVRYAAYGQGFLLSLTAFLGIFHYHPTPVKELGAGLLITHVALTVALLVNMHRQSLSVLDGLLGAMFLDAQNNFLSIQLTMKETVASRWQIVTVMVGQVSGFVTIALVVRQFQSGMLNKEQCDCFSVFWWASFSSANCPMPQGAEKGRDTISFWIYFAVRAASLVETFARTIVVAPMFHAAQKEQRFYPCGMQERNVRHQRTACLRCNECSKCHYTREPCPACDFCDQCRFCRNCGQKNLANNNGLVYMDQPATSTFLFFQHGALAAISVWMTENAKSASSVQPNAALDSYGQIIALVILAASTLRWFWYTAFMFIRDK